MTNRNSNVLACCRQQVLWARARVQAFNLKPHDAIFGQTVLSGGFEVSTSLQTSNRIASSSDYGNITFVILSIDTWFGLLKHCQLLLWAHPHSVLRPPCFCARHMRTWDLSEFHSRPPTVIFSCAWAARAVMCPVEFHSLSRFRLCLKETAFFPIKLVCKS